MNACDMSGGRPYQENPTSFRFRSDITQLLPPIFLAHLIGSTNPPMAGGSRARGIHFWYAEHDARRNDTDVQDGRAGDWGDTGFQVREALTGGIGACSTDDFVDWRMEGIVLHYSNVSDMVLGRIPEEGMVLQQPKASM